MAMKALSEILNMGKATAIGWLRNNQGDWVLVNKADEAAWFQEMLDYLESPDESTKPRT